MYIFKVIIKWKLMKLCQIRICNLEVKNCEIKKNIYSISFLYFPEFGFCSNMLTIVFFFFHNP